MESGKQGSSDASSEENDRVDQVKGGDTASTTTKRSYECTFCKRGFTNAQALGGHMNIHRKDRAKAKQPSSSSLPSDQPVNEEHMNPSHLPRIPNQLRTQYFPILEAQRNTYHHMYFQPPVSSPRLPYVYHDHSDFLVPAAAMSQSLSLNMNEELLGANLSLQIGPAHVDDSEVIRKGIMKEDEVDLELRLGHDPSTS